MPKQAASKQNAKTSKIHIDIKANHFKIALSRGGDQREKHQKLLFRTTKYRQSRNRETKTQRISVKFKNRSHCGKSEKPTGWLCVDVCVCVFRENVYSVMPFEYPKKDSTNHCKATRANKNLWCSHRHNIMHFDPCLALVAFFPLFHFSALCIQNQSKPCWEQL